MAEPLKATFFTLKHRDRAVLLPATFVLVVILALIVAAWTALNWRTLGLIFETFRTFPAQLDDAQGMALFTGMMGLFLWTMLLLLPLYIAIASYEAACLRWMIRGEAPGLFGLTLDHDTWRVYGIYWCWLVTHMAIGMVASMLTMPIMFMMMGDIIAQAPQEPDPQAMWDLQIKMQALSVIQYIPMIFIGIRLGPAAATSIARRRFSFFEAWTVTSDRFWALLGAYAFWACVVIVLWMAPAVISFFVEYGGSWDAFSAMWTQPPTPEQMEELWAQAFTFTPARIMLSALAIGMSLIAGVLWTLFTYGINARAALAALEEGKIEEAPPET